MKHTFNNAQPIPDLLDEGDYILEVIESVDGISRGAKTSGSEQFELKLREEKTGKIIYETLILCDSLAWKVDGFIQAFNIPAVEGEEIELNAPDFVGLRGWVKLNQETYNEKTKNRIAIFYTDKEKLERVEVDEFAEEDTPF
tara:strand:- start:171 stop:596 length:426 start_codon:yes stop_codon:yes gene_type:complete